MVGDRDAVPERKREKTMTKQKTPTKPSTAQRRAEFVALMAQELRHVTGGGGADTGPNTLLCW